MSKIKQTELDGLAAKIIEQKVCQELAAQATQLVMGDGNPNADIVFIGEAPGKNEDEKGLPFVGAAGKFLDEMLAAAGMNRADVYITNIVKYRPPGNRDPLPEEKQAFWPYLARQLEIIDPRAIVTLGRHSMEFFIPDGRISQIHGHAVHKNVTYHDHIEHNWLIIPLYHPAAALYNGSLRQTLIDDFLGAAKLVEQYRDHKVVSISERLIRESYPS
ncbi:MAG TPA: uracil-DNA glycosylase [Candidatus Saccharimonadaceae bacterium]|nr:uracil-DNA glycosylase [Candidatus Saccharimonadaceae bacterium]